jgi:ubiquinone/menaquinone biosynthesis C-methylase UbiE
MAAPPQTAPVETREDLVEALFHGTGSTYGEMVHFATLGRDKKWKEELLDLMVEPKRVLDLASGTGILSLEMAGRFNCHVTGVELREEYCVEARERAVALGITDVRFFVSPAEQFEIDETFDYITSCYIPKYIARLDVLVTNLVKMLAPGGQILLQDFAYPAKPWVQDIFDQHFQRMQERAATEHPDWMTMFERLPAVIRESKWVETLVSQMEANGLVDVRVVLQSQGLSAIVTGHKPK